MTRCFSRQKLFLLCTGIVQLCVFSSNSNKLGFCFYFECQRLYQALVLVFSRRKSKVCLIRTRSWGQKASRYRWKSLASGIWLRPLQTRSINDRVAIVASVASLGMVDLAEMGCAPFLHTSPFHFVGQTLFSNYGEGDTLVVAVDLYAMKKMKSWQIVALQKHIISLRENQLGFPRDDHQRHWHFCKEKVDCASCISKQNNNNRHTYITIPHRMR